MRIPNELDTYKLLGAINLRKPFGPRDHAFTRLSLHTGVRVSELIAIDVGHVWSNGAPRSWLDLPAPNCKGKRSGQIPLNKSAQKAITELVQFLRARGFSTDPDAPLLTDRRHRRLTPREVQRSIQKYREIAGLDIRVTPHSLRHYADSLIMPTARCPSERKLMFAGLCIDLSPIDSRHILVPLSAPGQLRSGAIKVILTAGKRCLGPTDPY